MRTRGFEEITEKYKIDGIETYLPKRGTTHSACYDFRIGKEVTIWPEETVVVPTNIKAYMQPDEVLLIFIRSSVGIKRGIIISNGTGVIDSDYYGNIDNDGNIFIALTNIEPQPTGEGHFPSSPQRFNKGDKIAQGMFVKFLKADDDTTTEERTGGIGSTGG